MTVKANKQLGQNFLNNPEVCKRMVELLDLKPGETIIELGAGMGAVTQQLLSQTDNTNNVKLIELDARFIQHLTELVQAFPQTNATVIRDDILQYLAKFSGNQTTKVIGAIPYYITSPIIHEIIRMETLPKTVVLLIQKEVAEKISEQTPDTSYLSTITQTFYNAELVAHVDKNAFTPSPKVDSAILKLELRNEINIAGEQLRKYEGFLHRAYSNPRKMLNKVFAKEELEKANMDGSVRPQNLSPDDWANAFKKLITH